MNKKSQGMFDRKRLKIEDISNRKHDLDISAVMDLGDAREFLENPDLEKTAFSLVDAKRKKASSIFMMGAHVIRCGAQNYLIDLMKRGYITCIAMNGAGVIHDFELAMMGATTENVAFYIKEGRFGLWKETGCLNDIVNSAFEKDSLSGLGQAVGEHIEGSSYRWKSLSITAAAFRLGIPVTVHVGIGYDIIHEHPNFSGAATGALSYNDFLKFAFQVESLENGVLMSFGSAVMAPEVFLKALSMARNVAFQEGRSVRCFTTLVCDLVQLPDDLTREAPKTDSSYYFRPYKTLLVRTAKDGGKSFYVKASHRETIPALWAYLNKAEAAYG